MCARIYAEQHTHTHTHVQVQKARAGARQRAKDGSRQELERKNAPKASSTTNDSNAARKVENVDAERARWRIEGTVFYTREFLLAFFCSGPGDSLARIGGGAVEHTLIEIQILNDSCAPQLSE